MVQLNKDGSAFDATDPHGTRPKDVNEAGDARFEDSEPMTPPAPKADEPPTPVLADVWRNLDAWQTADGADWLEHSPPKRRYLLSTMFKDTRKGAEEPRGVLPLGRVGMLAAGGGLGKSWALTQLALSVATGRDWLDTYTIDEPGPVLLALGEEEPEEMRRRFYYAAQLIKLTPTEREAARRNLWLLPLVGKPVALMHSVEEIRNQGAPLGPLDYATDFYRELRQRLDGAGIDWRLLILDPISRFAGPDVEIDNAAATRFVQTLERLTDTRGGPTLLVAHHTNKMARIGTTDATAARGSSALTDGVRWQANLDAVPHPDNPKAQHPDLAVLRVVKNNYGWFPPALTLHRVRDHNGALRAATMQEIEEYKEAERKADIARRAEEKKRKKQAGQQVGDNGKAKTDGDAAEGEPTFTLGADV